ncbi:YkyB family protein [Ammoniphilus sp. 3BR4]|uniref:YkyB family protein n=1 Tax=Ammoniphilus sp. 3BR4 TaxID=3158265 RepID=UPI0034652A24
MQLFTKKNQVPSEYKTKEELQKMGKIPVGAPIAKLKDKDRYHYLFDLKQSAPIPSRHSTQINPTVDNLAKALFAVNRHAKTSPQPQKLYQLKTSVIEKLIDEGKASKVGLQQSPNPSKYHQQTSNTLVKVGEYGFHILSTREDLLSLPHLGEWSDDFRNPTETFPLRQAVQLLEQYIRPLETHPPANIKRPAPNPKPNHRRKPFFDPFPKR